MKYLLIAIFSLSPIVMQACTPIGMATTAAVTGGTAAAREAGFKQTAIDTRIKLEINELWFNYDLDAFSKLSVTVEEGRVLVTGVVQNPDHRVEAIRLAWQPEGVVQVINEVRVADSEGLSGFARDNLITGNLRSKIIFDKEIKSINYTIETVQGTVYLMGTAQDRAELNKVISHARNTSYVRQVVSYVKMKDEPIEGIADPVVAQSADL